MNSNGKWKLRVRNKATKALLKFPQRDRGRILNVIERLQKNPFVGDIEKMKGGGHSWRRRIGSYRILYEIKPDDRVIYVFRIERRTSKTY